MRQDTVIAQPTLDSTMIPYLLPDSLAMPEEEAPNEYLMLCDDSITAHHVQPEPIMRKSLFHGSIRSNPNVTPRPRPADTSFDWIFGIIILLIVLISIHLNAQRYKLRDILHATFDLRVRERVWRENNIRIWALLPMTGIYLASLSMVILFITQRYGVTPEYLAPPVFYLIITGGLIAFILLKNGLIRMLGNIFNSTEGTSSYIIGSHLFYFIGSLVMPLPLLLMYFGADWLASIALRVALAIITILFVVRVLRGLQLFLTNSGSSKLYLFYYLCILEIAPILVMVKILTI